MSTQPFASTPAFELFRRGLVTQTIQNFHGLNAFSNIALLGPDWAQDCLNIFVPGNGGLSKFRLPVPISAGVAGFGTGPNSFWDFQQANGLRQVLAQFGQSLYYFTSDLGAATLIESNPLNAGLWSFVTANNILFGANGQRMQKWTGANWQLWGIVGPANAPFANTPAIAISASRTTNVVTVTVPAATGEMPAAGDIIVLANMTDSTFNGQFTVTASNFSAFTFTFAQTAANSTATGNLVLFSYVIHRAITAITRTAGTVVATVATAAGIAVGDYMAVTGVSDTSFNGTNFVVTATTATTVTWTQGGLNDSTSSGGTLDFALTPTTGYQYTAAYGNSLTGHVSNQSPIGFAITQNGFTFGRKIVVQIAPSSDPQVNQYYWFRTLDGGSDFFLAGITTTPIFNDTQPDTALNQTVRGPLINNPPLQGNYTASGQGRVFVANLTNAPQDIIYSGYEQIFLGRPEESFPPNNRLRLSIGAESIAGIGVLQAGLVAFSQTSRMYMLRGAVEDISLAQPVAFSAYLEELPWTLGCASHFTIQNTPYGLMWLAGDKTVQLYNGHSEPVDLSYGVYPLLQQITPGTETKCVAGYFNWLERDVYVLLAAVQGSTLINRMFMFAFNKTPGTNTIESVELFVSNIPQVLNTNDVNWVGLITSSTRQRKICIGSGGFIQQLQISSDTYNGLNLDPSIIPATSGTLTAFWKGGYFGNDQPQRSKSWRFLNMLSDQDPGTFQAVIRYVNNRDATILQPEIVPKTFNYSNPRIALDGHRAMRASVEIDFPAADVSANVVELQVASISTSDR